MEGRFLSFFLFSFLLSISVRREEKEKKTPSFLSLSSFLLFLTHSLHHSHPSSLPQLAKPYWTDAETGPSARWKLATVVGLTLATTGVSVLFNFLGRDFFNALSEKDAARFTQMLFKWLGAIGAGVPVFVLRDWLQSRLALDWRQNLTEG